jgi:hypothetical protein
VDNKNQIVLIAEQVNLCRQNLEGRLGGGFDRRDGRRDNELVRKEPG